MSKYTYTETAVADSAIALIKAVDKANKGTEKVIVALLDSCPEVKTAGGYESLKDADKRKALDAATDAINSRIAVLKALNKEVTKEERKPLKDNDEYRGQRKQLGLVASYRSRLRTEAEKDTAKKLIADSKATAEKKIIEKAIQEGKVISADDVQNIKTCTSLEEGVVALIEMSRKCKVSLDSLQDMIARRF